MTTDNRCPKCGYYKDTPNHEYGCSEISRVRNAYSQLSHEIEQTLGKALGYPHYTEDVGPAEDVCVGEHVPESLANEAADKIKEQSVEIERLRNINRELVASHNALLIACARQDEVVRTLHSGLYGVTE